MHKIPFWTELSEAAVVIIAAICSRICRANAWGDAPSRLFQKLRSTNRVRNDSGSIGYSLSSCGVLLQLKVVAQRTGPFCGVLSFLVQMHPQIIKVRLRKCFFRFAAGSLPVPRGE